MTKHDIKNKVRPIAPVYLEYVKLTSFGKFANMIVGPFKPGMNVIYGVNEAGKTTISELVKGVMFGWTPARKTANSYKPENAERIGSLFFKDVETGEVEEMKRAKNSEGVDDVFGVLDDIDEETYNTMFALNSDELLKLDRHNEVTARLLTAGSGTVASPARVLNTIQEKIKAKMSRSAQNSDSIALLREERAHYQARVQNLLDETEKHVEQEKYLDSLDARSEALAEAQSGLNSEIEELKSNRARLESIDEALAHNTELLEETIAAQEAAAATSEDAFSEEVAALAQLSATEEYQLKTALDDLEDERIKREHALDNARREANKSRTAYETLVSDHDYQTEQDRARKQRRIRLVVALVIMVGMAIVGLWMFRQGRAVASLTYSAFGVLLCLAALLVGAAGVMVNSRPSKTEEAYEERKRDHEWVKQQDEQHLELCERDLGEQKAKIGWYLKQNGLSTAGDSIRQARHLIELAHDLRNNTEALKQNAQALTLQRASLESLLKNLCDQRQELFTAMDFDSNASLAQIDRIIARKETERNKTTQLISETSLQYGEISSELSRAKHDTDFDKAKQRKAILDAQLEEQYEDLAVLLLAEHSLEAAIADWERKSQPEVYVQASRLFEQMTGGAWQTVRMNAAGCIEVLDSVRTAVSPQLLSLGTRQQLYLALRVALLITARNVGRCLPILCDDILVNFDDQRRREAVQVLVELSRHRQVILFTCHPSVVELVRDYDRTGNIIEL